MQTLHPASQLVLPAWDEAASNSFHAVKAQQPQRSPAPHISPFSGNRNEN